MSTPIRAGLRGRAETPPPGYLVSREAARLLGVKPQTLYAPRRPRPR